MPLNLRGKVWWGGEVRVGAKEMRHLVVSWTEQSTGGEKEDLKKYGGFMGPVHGVKEKLNDFVILFIF